MTYRVDITRKAEKQMRDLSQTVRRRIGNRIDALEADPYKNASKLATLPGFRARVGDYRILYEVNEGEKVVRINEIRHRREAYR